MDGDSITSRSSIFSDSASDDDWNAAIPAKIPTKEAANAACDTNATFKRNKTVGISSCIIVMLPFDLQCILVGR